MRSGSAVQLGCYLWSYGPGSNRRLGYFIVAVIAVLLPGIDPVTTTLEAIPLIGLYELSIWLAVLMDKRAARAQPASVTDP